VAGVTWSGSVADAEWVRDRLTAPYGSCVTSVVPAGFAAYARILHPAAARDTAGDHPVSWAEVGAWSGLELRDDACFHSVALPPKGGPAPAPPCQPPRRGSLGAAEAGALIAVLRAATSTPERCWFCLWEGYAWQGRVSDPIPPDILDGPRVTLGRRDYVLYTGPVEAATTVTEPEAQTANVWWPEDRAWCAVSDIDLPWTYVAGTEETVAKLVATPGLEVLRARAEDPVRRIEDWVNRWVATGTDELMRGGNTRIETTRGVVAAWFDRPGLTPGALGVTSEAPGGQKSARRTTVEHRGEEDLRRLLGLHLTMHVVDLVEG
jgi:hypothetical protein